MSQQLELVNTRTEIEPCPPPNGKRNGPPNRMNDLNYSTWMKFQKSFFRDSGLSDLVFECIQFFTKAVWPDGQPSRILLIGFNDFDTARITPPREVVCRSAKNTSQALSHLEAIIQAEEIYDFVLVNFIGALTAPCQLEDFLNHQAGHFFRSLRTVTAPDRYCGVLVELPEHGGQGFPTPWSVALSARDEIRLRDEKIGLVESEGRLYYCLFMQSIDDAIGASFIDAKSLCLADPPVQVPGWIIPRPPPRTRKELLHPAKFPETLIGQFIDIFTDPGDIVFDPMMGTGSTVLAAVQTGRHGIGLDLSHDYVALAEQRMQEAFPPTLFAEFDAQVKWKFLQGDATELLAQPELRQSNISYCVTSPPYWSMLQNPGSEGQRARRQKGLRLTYSENSRDLGNIEDYERFLALLVTVYEQVCKLLESGGYLTVIVKNVKRDHVLYTLAWDLTKRLCGPEGVYDYVGTTLWCQDDVGLKPFAVGTHWVSNILHQYCLHFRKKALT